MLIDLGQLVEPVAAQEAADPGDAVVVVAGDRGEPRIVRLRAVDGVHRAELEHA